MERILGIIVTYHPDPHNLRKLVRSLQQQVNHIVIVDNHTPGLTPEAFCFSEKHISWIINEENLGVATAYNQGIAIAMAQNASHVLIFDQDSNPAENMVKQLLSAMNKHSHPRNQIAAAGPEYADVKGQDRSPFVRLECLKLIRVTCNEEGIADVDHLISSGCLIDLKCLHHIGGFVDELFIDYVDTEWCWRARRKGYRLIGVGAAKMSHNLGDNQIYILGKRYPLHAPFRLYYLMRNQWWMLRQPWVGWRWRFMDILRCLKIIAVFLIFVPNRLIYLSSISRGIIDGMRSRMGKLGKQ